MTLTLENLNLSELKAFVLTYESGSFALVAQKHGKHASTYSRRVSNLELDLGLTLFERHGSHILPTEQGKSLYHPAKSIITEIAHFAQRVQLCQEEYEPQLKVAVDSSLSAFAPDKILSQILTEFPATEIELMTGNTKQVINLIESKQADTGLVLCCYNYSSLVTNNKLFDFRVVRVMAPDYAQKMGIDPREPLEADCIRSLTQIVLSPVNELGINTQNYSNHLIHVDSFSMAKSLAINGNGWCNLPLEECRESLAAGELLPFQAKHDNELSWAVDAIWPIDKNRGIVAQQFVEQFTQHAMSLV